MNGRATQLFIERLKEKQVPYKPSNKRWPRLEKMLSYGCITPLDLAIVRKYAPDCSEEIAAFICHLSLASRIGHLCIKIKNDTVIPSITDLWVTDGDTQKLSQDEFMQLADMITHGAKEVAFPLVSDHANISVVTPIKKYHSSYCFHKSWSIQTTFLDNLKSLLAHNTPSITIDLNAVNLKLADLQQQQKLLPEQAAAIAKSCQSSFTIITGGPGTGKTYTAGLLIKMILEATTHHQKPLNIILAAPTGKAAANLEGSIAKSLSLMSNMPAIPGKTLHQILKINKNRTTDQDVILPADIIIVDECSMIDADLMGKLLWSIKPGARLVLLGDKNQLPSVEAGSFFADLTSFLIDKSHVIELKKCLRSESQEISHCCDGLKEGNAQPLIDLFTNTSNATTVSCLFLPEATNPKDQQRAIIKSILARMASHQNDPFDPAYLLNSLNSFRVLTPLRKGPLGSEALNTAIFNAIHKQSPSQHFYAIPIMIVKNDYQQNLFNGEVGILFQHTESPKDNYAVFQSRNANKPLRKIPAILLPKYELAYCLSIHKSQGSEFDHVMLLLPQGSEAFGREGLYTGATRAKKRLEIWSHPMILESMATRSGLRLSSFSDD